MPGEALALGDERLPARFWQRVQQEGTCWLWTGATNDAGYGQLHWQGKTVYAHRLAFGVVSPELLRKGFHLDHFTCQTPRCVNPEHLEAVTPSENIRRGYGNTCSRGHELTEDNVYYTPRGARQCRICKRWRERVHRRWTNGLRKEQHMNRVFLVGNVGKDAEKRGSAVTFSLATNAGKDRQPDWHTIKCFGKSAELCENVTKGTKLAIEGRLTYNTFEKDGQRRTFAEVIADRVEFLSPKGKQESRSTPGDDIPF